MEIDLPELSLILLIGNESHGKQAFVKKHFNLDEVLYVNKTHSWSDDDQTKSDNRQPLAYEIARARLKDAKLTAVNIDEDSEQDKKEIIYLAKRYHVFPVAIVFKNYEEGNFDQEDIQKKREALKNSLEEEGFRYVYVLMNQEEAKEAKVKRSKLHNNKRDVKGPFDIIGDVHGCYDELVELLRKLGYRVDEEKYMAEHPEGRILVFVGDLVDRGPKSMDVLRLVMNLVKAGKAYSVVGNHDNKLLRKLNGANVKVAHGLETTVEEMKNERESFIEEVRQFLDKRISHYVFDEGRLVVVHAGLKEKYHGRGSSKIRSLSMFGETTGKLDEHGFPERLNWAQDYHGKALVVYGHTPHEDVVLINNTANIDTGCVFGGKLTAFRYPEREIVSVKAKKTYYKSGRPLLKQTTCSI